MESKELVASSQSQSQIAQPPVYNLFDDPVLKRAKAELTPEQREAYAKAGEQMYNFDYGSGEQDLNKVLKDACNRVCHMVRHGLHPSLLEKEDLDVINMDEIQMAVGITSFVFHPCWILSTHYYLL